MIVFDTEDDSAELMKAGRSGFDKQVSQIAGITDTGETFWNKGDVLDFLSWAGETGESDVWAFNAQYDIGNLCNKPSDDLRLYHFDSKLVKSRFISATCRGFNFFDVHNLSGQGSSVGSLGLAVGLPKFGFPYTPEEMKKFSAYHQREYTRFSGMTDAEKFRNKEYVIRDCEIPMRWLKFIQQQCLEFGIERIPATLGGLCVKAFAALGYRNWFEASKTTEAACYGGRVELFCKGGTGHIVYVDVNSLYPFCMTQKFPDCIEKIPRRIGIECEGIADCLISVPHKMRVAPLPVHDADGRLTFPVGVLRGIWTCAELRAAVETGCTIQKLFSVSGSRTASRYYADYVSEMYSRRLKSKTEAEKLFWKLLMNNLYGRLKIGGVVSRTCKLTRENCEKGIVFGDKVLMDQIMPLPEFTNYLHAAHVLSYARIHLLKFMRRIAPENLIYCDTDSIIFFHQPADPLPFPLSDQLGEMKLEGIGDRCEVLLPKTYHFAGKGFDKWKAKGVPRRLAKEFIRHGSVEFDQPFKLRESIRFFEKNNSRKLSVWRNVEKVRQSEYDRKRISGNFYLPKIVKMA